MSENNRSDSQDWRVDYLMLAALWGSSFLFMRMGAAEFGPLATAWTRVCVATLFLFPFMLWQGHWALFKSKWKIILGFGVFNSALPFALFAYAVMHISTGLSAILNAAVPLFAAVIAWLWLDDRLNRWRIAGLFIGFMGVTLLADNQTSFHSAANPDTSPWGQYTAIAACLVATLCYAISGSFTKKFMPNLPPLVSSTGSQLGACLALALPALWAMPEAMPSTQAWLSIVILGVACTGIAYILYFRLVNRAGPAKALTVTFLIPVFALIYGVAFLGEAVTLSMLFLGAVVVFGTALSSGLFPKKRNDQIMKRLPFILLLCLSASFTAFAQNASVNNPVAGNQSPIRLIVPFTPGTGIDLIARTVGPKLSQRLGRPVVVENRVGASGNIGTEAVVRAAPDGQTLLVSVNTLVMNKSLYTSLSFDPVKDLAPVILTSWGQLLLVTHPKTNFKTPLDLVAAAKANPGRINYASPGVGTPHHLAMELFKNTSKVFLTHIPYRGTAPAVTDLLGGQVDAMFLPIHVALPQIRAGKLIALGLGSEQRHPLLPNVPTIAESKAGQVNVDMWFGIFAPKNTPNDIIQAYNKEIKLILASEDIQKAFQPQGMDPANSTPEEFGRLVEKDAIRWAELIKSQNIKAE